MVGRAFHDAGIVPPVADLPAATHPADDASGPPATDDPRTVPPVGTTPSDIDASTDWSDLDVRIVPPVEGRGSQAFGLFAGRLSLAVHGREVLRAAAGNVPQDRGDGPAVAGGVGGIGEDSRSVRGDDGRSDGGVRPVCGGDEGARGAVPEEHRGAASAGARAPGGVGEPVRGVEPARRRGGGGERAGDPPEAIRAVVAPSRGGQGLAATEAGAARSFRSAGGRARRR